MCIMGVSEVEERKTGTERSFEEIMTENVLNLRKDVDIQIQDAQ